MIRFSKLTAFFAGCLLLAVYTAAASAADTSKDEAAIRAYVIAARASVAAPSR